MKKMFQEFKEFISRGNVIDLAVGVIIGSAFTAIVNALVANLITPLVEVVVQAFTGQEDFSGLKFTVGSVDFVYGNIITAVINFLLTAVVVFLFVKLINQLNRKKEEAPAPKAYICPRCRSEVDEKATKCPACTADMTPVEKA